MEWLVIGLVESPENGSDSALRLDQGLDQDPGVNDASDQFDRPLTLAFRTSASTTSAEKVSLWTAIRSTRRS